jgi:four helix bundle protein
VENGARELAEIYTMTYDRFEDLPLWRKAARLYESVEELLENESFHASRGFRDQLDRAGLSVSNNIAEGFERGTTNELLQFIYIARGTAGEVRSMLTLKLRHATKHRWTESLKSQIRLEFAGRIMFSPIARLGRLSQI